MFAIAHANLHANYFVGSLVQREDSRVLLCVSSIQINVEGR